MENSLVQNLAALKHLPFLWDVRDFKDVIKDASGGNKKTLKTDFLDEGEFVIVDQGKNVIAGYTNNKELLVKSLPPYVIFGDHTRIFKYIDVPFAMGADGTKVLKPKKDGINEKFLYYFFLTLNIPNTGYNRHFKYLKNIKIPLPPLAEQKKIAAILDAADSLRQKDQQLIDHYTTLSQSLFLDMFGDPNINPKHWPIVDLKEIINDGPQNGLYKPSKDYGRGVPIVRIDSFYNDIVMLNKLKRLSVNEIEMNRFEIFEGDFVINRVNSPSHLGKCGLVPKIEERMVFESNMMKIKFSKERANNIFLLFMLSSRHLKIQILNSSKDAVNQSSINQNDVNNFKIPLPPIDLQNQFAKDIAAIEQQKQLAQASLEKSEALFNSLLQRAFKGELTARQAA